MPPPSLVLFDMDDVLCSYSIERRAAYLARLAGSTTEAVLAAIWGSGFETLADNGTIDAAAYLRGCGERIGHRLTLQEWIDARRAATAPQTEVLELVQRVRQKAKVAVLTNNPTLVEDHIQLLFPELPPLFGSSIYASAGFKTAKPAAECYQRCLSVLGIAPADALFIDDLPENVAGAQAAGLAAHNFTSAHALAEFLRGRGLL